MRRREGTYHCEKCGAPHVRIGVHNEGGMVTADDRPELTRAILAAFADAGTPASLGDMQHVICPQPGRFDGRTRAGRALIERKLEMYWLATELAEAGMLRLVDEPCGEFRWGFAITAAGRAYLAWNKPAA